MIIYIYTSSSRASRGRKFHKKKNYIAKKEFAYKMCARRPTSAMPKPFLCRERAFCCSMVVMWPVLLHVMSFDVVVMSFDAMWLLMLCHVTWCNAMSCDVRSCDVPCNGHVVCSKWFCDDVVIQSTTPVLFCTTKYYSSTTLYYTVLQRTTPVLHCTTKYYSVLQSTTPILLCITKYYSTSTLYYKVLLQYYSVLHSTTPVLLCITKYYSSTSLYCNLLLQYYSVLQSTTPVLLCTSQYYNVLLQDYSVLQSTTPVLLCTTKQHSWLILDTYEPLFTFARSNRSHPPTPPNTAPATQNDCDDWSASHMKRHLQCAEQQESQSNFTKYCARHAKWISWLIRVSHETSFTMRGGTGITIQLHQILRLPGTWISWLIRIRYETSFTMRGATRVTLQLQQILRLPRKVTLMIVAPHIWNVIYNARSNTGFHPTPPNTAPAMKFWVQDVSGNSMNCFRQ